MTRKEYYYKNKIKIQKQQKLIHLKNPWITHLYDATKRCNNPKNISAKYYFDKGIKCELNKKEIKELWFRDKAYLMKKPSIDRIKSNLNYTFDNCQFIELSKNIQKVFIKPILQFDKKGNFIKEWSSIISVEETLGILHTSICNNLKGLSQSAGGFIWRYKNG